MRRIPSAVAVVGAASAIWLAAAAPAGAHSAVTSTSPADGAVVETGPGELRIAFTEPPDLSLTNVELVDASGATVALGPIDRPPGEDREIVAAVQEELPDGVYTVTWSTVSRTDGHPTAGAFTFGVGVTVDDVPPPPEGPTTTTVAPTVQSVAGRWMLYVGLAVLFGAAIAAMFAPGPQWIRNGWLLAGAWVVAAGGVVGMILAERAAIGVPVGTLLSSDTGGAFVRLAVAVGVAGFATLVVALRPGRATLLVLAGAVGAAMLVRAGGSHAGGGTTNVLVHALHLAGVGAWIGGLVWLFFGVKRGLEPSAVRRFSNLAAVGLAVVLVSGVLRAANELGGFLWWLDPFETDYRTALVVKLALIAPLVGLGALNRFRNIPRIERAGSKPLLRTVGGEVFLAAAVFAAAGVMTGLPPRGTEAAGPTPTPTPAQEPVVVTGSDFATTTRVRLAITPGTVGANEFVAEVTDYDTGEPIDARSVTIRFSFPERPELRTRLELEHGADGTWRASSTALSMAGTWDLGILVEGATDSIDVDLRVTPITPGQRIDVTETPGLPTIVTVTDANAYAVQVYTDPGDPDGPNTVHVTAFDPQGAELPLASASIDLFAPHGHSIVPELERLGSGHFSASLLRGELVPGVWTYTISVVGEDGTMITAAFEQTFEA